MKERAARTSVAGTSLKIDQWGRYWVRIQRGHGRENRRRSWKLLKAVTQKAAITEGVREQEKAKKSLPSGPLTFMALSKMYLDAGCPDARLQMRKDNPGFIANEKVNIEWLNEWWGGHKAGEIRLHHIPDYAEWRVGTIEKKQSDGTKCSGGTTIDHELVTASNVLTYGVLTGRLEFNYIKLNRPKYAKDVKHCITKAPSDGTTLNKIVDYLFDDLRSETTGWMTLFASAFGLRRKELLWLKKDAKLTGTEPEPGLVLDGKLYVKRAKQRNRTPVGDVIELDEIQKEIIECFLNWHQERFSKSPSPWFFPGADPEECITKDAFGRALARACEKLELPHVSPHGCRSFFGTKKRRDGHSDEECAEMMSQRDVDTFRTVYRDKIKGAKLSYYPSEGLPAWHRWKPAADKIVKLER